MITYRAYDEYLIAMNPSNPFFLDHVSRYWWAAEKAGEKEVLDCACGQGYGSYILSKKAKRVLGIDLNGATLGGAIKTFHRPNLEFREFDVLKLPQLGRKFDLITAFEVIEHLPPEMTDSFIASLAGSLNPGGEFLVSTPNHDVVLKSGSTVPEFHINNFRAPELQRKLQKHFRQVRMLGQFQARAGLSGLVFDLDRWNLRHFLGQPLKRLLGGGQGAVTDVRSENRLLLSYYETPYAGVERYRFSSEHWRQAGLTVAACSNPYMHLGHKNSVGHRVLLFQKGAFVSPI